MLAFLMGCSGDGAMPNTPGFNQAKAYYDPQADRLRTLLWSTGSNDDEPIDDDSGVDRSADITNVVWGWEYSNYGLGDMKGVGIPWGQGDDYIYTVACWEESTGVGEGDIWFAVLWREGYYGDDEVAAVQQVDVGNADKLQKYPAVTAHLGEYGNDDYSIIVDVAYQLSQGYDPQIPWVGQWEIRHCRYAMPAYGDDSDFDSFDTLYEWTVSEDQMHDCIHPDIVFDCGYDDPTGGGNKLHLVYEVDDYENGQSIYYRFCELVTEEILAWDDSYQINNPGDQDSYPRIDVGMDSSTYIDVGDYAQAEQVYYVGVVWMHADYDDNLDDWYTNIHFCMLPPDGSYPPAGVQVRVLTENVSVRVIHALPFIEIGQPNAGDSRTTFIVWTYAVKEIGPGTIVIIEVYGNNTLRLANLGQYSHASLVDGSDVFNRNGLPTLALKETGNQDGYLVWLNDEWSLQNPNATDVEVYACDLSWDTDDEYEIYCVNFDNISKGLSSWAVNQGFTYGPEIAIFDFPLGKCVWTDIDNGTPSSIWGDSSDW
jgi:hypothetical protein